MRDGKSYLLHLYDERLGFVFKPALKTPAYCGKSMPKNLVSWLCMYTSKW